ncbi:FAD dependent oxidoreductase, partial [Oryctes borbonicus]
MEKRIFRIIIAITITSLYVTSGQLIEGILKIWLAGENQHSREPPDAQYLQSEYDFIIVGAGTAGCVLANRLTENPNWKVLLIEAGTQENYLMDIPMLANYLQFTENNWKYMTQPSGNFCLGMDNNQCHFPRGKVVGGSSVLNYMLYSRGHHKDFDKWAEMGNTGWSYEEVLPYFKKVENFQIPAMFNETYHGKNGYLSVTNPPFHTKIAASLVKAGTEMGWNYVDYNGRNMVGISFSQASLRDGVRDSSSRAYLHPINGRENLTVKKLTQVSKVLIDPRTKTAYGVECWTRGRKSPYVIRARKEVILSAGTIGSPQILMLSGVGPKNHLKQKRIPVMQNLKVGYNLMDHIACGGITFLVNETISLNTDKMFTSQNLNDYFHRHRGPISVPGGLEVCSFHDTENPDDPDAHPDIELFYLGGSMASDRTLHRNFAVRTELFEEVYGPIKGREAFMIFPMIL